MRQCRSTIKRFGKKRCLRFRDTISLIEFVKCVMKGPKISPNLKEEFKRLRRM